MPRPRRNDGSRLARLAEVVGVTDPRSPARPEDVIRAYVENDGYEIAGEGEARGMYPMDREPVLAALAALVAEREERAQRLLRAYENEGVGEVFALAAGAAEEAERQKERAVAAEAERETLRAALRDTEDGLVAFYAVAPVTVADLCDKWIDKSGALLGRVRARAALLGSTDG